MRALLLSIALIWAFPAFADEPLVPSVWENQSGSLLYLDEMDGEGRFTGRYVNGAAGYRCQGIEYPVEGRVFDPLISFTVVWIAGAETCHTITSWTGEIEGDVITTEWSLVRWNDPGSESGAGGFARFTGESRFERRD
ncbi:avidin/streptavidin family protein [Hyphobacterium sp. HN65]|uniref:Avidin/streptavidin family protein n=1 Tax=Hyphobacterium lacteum TaxID=3116575 RepID=A0ABU7LUB4_9PROT|nr:avidin/streptavidin family protein [Hyphobacterium sp. HN65]MEE2527206.1 avidin/streptavidin family protein [Hyphobacterium sp. HN65]